MLRSIFSVGDRVSLCGSSCAGTLYVEQTGCELRDPPVCIFHGLGLQVAVYPILINTANEG